MTAALVLVASYLLGSIPFSFLVARLRGVDVRTVGSGNVGATNVMRSAGKAAGIAAFLLDAGKGAAAAWIARRLAPGSVLASLAAMAAIVGHMYPVWLRFRGGKGVATGGGALAVMSPITFVSLAVVWAVLLKVTHKASVASIVVTVLVPVGVAIEHRSWWEVVAVIGLGALVMARHLGNIRRLLGNREHALSN
jgi:glycerol-3-phosphate acyltransferase PlsY